MARPSETGSRASVKPASGLAPAGFDPARVWKAATLGREGYCSSDLQDAAKCAIRDGFILGICAAAKEAAKADLPDGYLWSDSNRDKFLFGVEEAVKRIDAIAMEARSGETGTGSIEGDSAAPQGIAQ